MAAAGWEGEVLSALMHEDPSAAAVYRIASGFPYSMHSSGSTLDSIFPLRPWSATSRAGPQNTSLGRSVVLLEEESRTPAVQSFEGLAEMLIILDVGRTLEATCDAVLSPFHFFLPHFIQDAQVL